MIIDLYGHSQYCQWSTVCSTLNSSFWWNPYPWCCSSCTRSYQTLWFTSIICCGSPALLSCCGVLNWFCSLSWVFTILKCFKPLLQLTCSSADSWLQNWLFYKPLSLTFVYGLSLNIYRSGTKHPYVLAWFLWGSKFYTSVLFSNTVETTLCRVYPH